jgi:hypothetical protein
VSHTRCFRATIPRAHASRMRAAVTAFVAAYPGSRDRPEADRPPDQLGFSAHAGDPVLREINAATVVPDILPLLGCVGCRGKPDEAEAVQVRWRAAAAAGVVGARTEDRRGGGTVERGGPR